MESEDSKNNTCRRCGNCCHVDVAAYASREDLERWERQGRQDIIAHVRANGVTWSEDRFSNRFGLGITTCRMSCVYLRWDGPSAFCEIYETRTKVCRSYVPGSTGLCPRFHRKGR